MAKDCIVFVHTGFCSFGDQCRFHHPTPVNAQVKKEENNVNVHVNVNAYGMESVKPIRTVPCKFFHIGMCIKGENCTYLHCLPEVPPEELQLNSMGLPYREGEQECSYYMRNGQCGYGLACKFHHPEIIVYDLDEGYLQAHMEENYFEGVPQTHSWNGNQQVSVNAGFYRPNSEPVKISEPPVLSDADQPKRPGKDVCWHYERSGYCKYGKVCAFDHPPKSASEVGEGSSSNSTPNGIDPETEEE